MYKIVLQKPNELNGTAKSNGDVYEKNVFIRPRLTYKINSRFHCGN